MSDDIDRWDAQVRDEYQRPLAGEEDARERAVARLRCEPVPRRSRWLAGWWMDPDAMKLRPLIAVASLVAVLGVGALGGAWWATSRVVLTERLGADASQKPTASIEHAPRASPTAMTFVFRAPGASQVTLVGDFNGWDPLATPLRRTTLSDTWVVQVALERGLHAYAFVIDGSDWAADPGAPLAPEATFGRRNSLLVVGEGDPL